MMPELQGLLDRLDGPSAVILLDANILHAFDPSSSRHAAARTRLELALLNTRLLEPTPQHWTVLAEMAGKRRARGPLVTGAHLAALA